MPRIATAFGAGVARHGEICGALVGAAMALGLKSGREDAEDVATRNALYDKTDRLIGEFEQEFDTVRCIELTECDMTTPEGLAKSKELDLHHKVCPRFVAFVAKHASMLMTE